MINIGDDGYLSDVTLFSELNEGSREGSPDIRSLYATPLHINTATPTSYNHYNQVIAIWRSLIELSIPSNALRSTGGPHHLGATFTTIELLKVARHRCGLLRSAPLT